MSKNYGSLVVLAAFALLLTVLSVTAEAGRVTIDSFIDPVGDLVSTDTDDDAPSAIIQDDVSGVINGTRRAVATTNGIFALRVDIVSGGRLAFALDDSTTGSLLLTYAGTNEDDNPIGLGDGAGRDLTDGGIADAFAVKFSDLDQPSVRLTVGVKNQLADNSTISSMEISSGGTKWFPFSSFGSFDFTEVREVTLLVEGLTAGVDLKLDDFYTSQVPEPSTLVVFSLAAGAWFCTNRLRKRKRKS